jgi:O-acetylhomoserine (thiol)-lyase
MEGGIAGLALASGQAAITYAIQTIAEAGDNIVSASTLYGGTYNLFAHTLPQFGIEVRFADYRDPEAFEKLIDGRTKAVYCESIGNPLGNITDFEKLAEIAHAPRHAADRRQHRAHALPVPPHRARRRHRGAFADQVSRRPRQLHRRHHRRLGQVPLGRAQAKFKRLNEPDVSYHGVVYTEALGPAAFIGRARVVPLRNMGAAISPFNAFLVLQGIETVTLRMDRICENTLKVAQFLKGHAKVSWVNYAGLAEHKDHGLVKKYMGGRASGILTFGVKGAGTGSGRDSGARFQDALQLVVRLVNIGDCKSLACHPASTTHRQLSPDELARAGVSEDMVRLSIGIEHIDDILADLDQALQAA